MMSQRGPPIGCGFLRSQSRAAIVREGFTGPRPVSDDIAIGFRFPLEQMAAGQGGADLISHVHPFLSFWILFDFCCCVSSLLPRQREREREREKTRCLSGSPTCPSSSVVLFRSIGRTDRAHRSLAIQIFRAIGRLACQSAAIGPRWDPRSTCSSCWSMLAVFLCFFFHLANGCYRVFYRVF